MLLLVYEMRAGKPSSSTRWMKASLAMQEPTLKQKYFLQIFFLMLDLEPY